MPEELGSPWRTTGRGPLTMMLAVDCREFVAGQVTGISRFLRTLLSEIADRRPRLPTSLFVGPTAGVSVSAPHLQIQRLPDRPTLVWDQVLLPRALRHVRASVFFSPYYKAPLAAPCPTVVTVHDLIPCTFAAYRRGVSAVQANAFRMWATVMCRRAAIVVTDSRHSASEIHALLGVEPTRIHAVPVGVSAEFGPDIPADAVGGVTTRYHLRQPYLLAVTNFLPHKNVARLIAAYESLPPDVLRATQLVLAGAPRRHGAARPVPLQPLARPGVVLPGFIAPEDLPALYAGATALICPSLVEGFGLPVLEAMATGTPVVCAEAGALPEVAGDAALYVDPRDVGSIAGGLRRILQDEALRGTLVDRGLERAQLFAPQRTTSRLVDLLQDLAAGKGA